MPTLQVVYDKALLDNSFRERLSSNTEDALASVGIQPTSDIVNRIKEGLSAAKQMQEEFWLKYSNNPSVT